MVHITANLVKEQFLLSSLSGSMLLEITIKTQVIDIKLYCSNFIHQHMNRFTQVIPSSQIFFFPFSSSFELKQLFWGDVQKGTSSA